MDLETPVGLPTPEQAHPLLTGFISTVAAMSMSIDGAVPRSGGFDFREHWIGEAAAQASVFTQERLTLIEVDRWLSEFEEKDAMAVDILFREIVWAIRRYHRFTNFYLPSVPIVDPAIYPTIVPVEVLTISKADVDRIDVVKGSIEKVFDKLPAWLKRIMDVAMELLRLSRGITD